MLKLKNKLFISLIALFLAINFGASGQGCSMCKATAESSLKANKNKVGAGLNSGIIYLMSIPYVVGGVGVFFYIKNKGRIKDFLKGNF